MMQEKAMVSDALNSLNSGLKTYSDMISQTENQELRQALQQMRNETEKSQYELYQIAKNKNYYQPAGQASQNEINSLKSMFTGSTGWAGVSGSQGMSQSQGMTGSQNMTENQGTSVSSGNSGMPGQNSVMSAGVGMSGGMTGSTGSNVAGNTGMSGGSSGVGGSANYGNTGVSGK